MIRRSLPELSHIESPSSEPGTPFFVTLDQRVGAIFQIPLIDVEAPEFESGFVALGRYLSRLKPGVNAKFIARSAPTQEGGGATSRREAISQLGWVRNELFLVLETVPKISTLHRLLAGLRRSVEFSAFHHEIGFLREAGDFSGLAELGATPVPESELPSFFPARNSELLQTPHGLESGSHHIGVLIRETGPCLIPQARRLDLNTITHDALVTSVALRLQQLWDGMWLPEGALDAREFKNVPDGVFVFEGGRRAAVEVENTLKGRKRFQGILEGWHQSDVLFVLYVATKPEVFQGLKTFLAEGPLHRVPFGLVNWTELDAGTPFPWSAHGELDLFNRRTF